MNSILFPYQILAWYPVLGFRALFQMYSTVPTLNMGRLVSWGC
jgi:hypothetical protein